MHHMLNDQGQKKKRQINGSRNLNTQAKFLLTQPSITTFNPENSEASPAATSAMRFTSRQTPMTNLTKILPLLSSPSSNYRDGGAAEAGQTTQRLSGT